MPEAPQIGARAIPRAGDFQWNAIVVDDDPHISKDVAEFFEGHLFAGRTIAFKAIQQWEEAFDIIRDRKADLIILDVYRGEPKAGGDRIGEQVLAEIKKTGFAPVVIYTNLTEGLEDERSEFVRLVLKADGLQALQSALKAVFDSRLPQINRAIINHLDRTLRDYMWGFLIGNWSSFKAVADKPEFLRLLLQRLALSFVREGVGIATAEVFGGHDHASPSPDTVHPAEFYVKPPIGSDPLLGDIRLRKLGDKSEYLVVLWPSCDMVSGGGRLPKTNTVLCANASLLELFPETDKYKESPSGTAKRQLTELLKNNRDKNFGTADRFHFLPGILDIPHLVVDFQQVERLTLDQTRHLPCLGSLASPYAEHISSRFTRYLSRVGTPDPDLQLVIDSLPVLAKLAAVPPAPPKENYPEKPDPKKSNTSLDKSRKHRPNPLKPKSRK